MFVVWVIFLFILATIGILLSLAIVSWAVFDIINWWRNNE